MNVCALCGRGIGSAPRFSTLGVVLAPDDPYVRYCNTAFHWSCYEGWPERPEFARRIVDTWIDEEGRSMLWRPLFLDERGYVSLKRSPMEEVSVRLFATGTQIRVPTGETGDWERWLNYPRGTQRELHHAEEKELELLVPEVRRLFPTGRSLREADTAILRRDGAAPALAGTAG